MLGIMSLFLYIHVVRLQLEKEAKSINIRKDNKAEDVHCLRL